MRDLGELVTAQQVRARITDVRKPDPLFAGFKVLKAPDVPSILVEMGYITSPSEENRFESSSYRAKLAGAGVRIETVRGIGYRMIPS